MKQTKTNPLHILNIGAGAVGGYYSAKLQQAGCHVTLACRSDYSTVVKKGIAIHSIDGDFHFSPDRVINDIAHYGQPAADILFITLKVLPEIDLPTMIAPAVGENTTIVMVQNGVEIEKPIQDAFPNNPLISGLAFVCLNRTAPGEITHLDYGRLALGRYPNGPSEMVQQLAKLFESVNVPCLVTEQVTQARWRKLIWNAPFNGISVLTQSDTLEIMQNPETLELSRCVMEEVFQIAAACGHPLPDTIVETNLRDTFKMKPYKTSMLLDYQAERPLEVEAILGNAIRAARRVGISAPHMTTIYSLLKLTNEKNSRV
ncbi:MAG: 2-dehydropantoate 2-reductase [Magnetococcales bacterium]|nr:2-dehydropantoate 2-reductase [Magnetococcales bacterium]